MLPNRFTVVLDACVLVPALKRDILLSLAEAQLFRPAWSSQILDEAERTVARLLNDKGAADGRDRARHIRHIVEKTFPEALTEGEALLVPDGGFSWMTDRKDSHVVATALVARADQIITDNLADFPGAELGVLRLEVRSADAFIADTLDVSANREAGLAAIARMRRRFNNPSLTPDELLVRMEARGLLATAALLAEHRECW